MQTPDVHNITRPPAAALIPNAYFSQTRRVFTYLSYSLGAVGVAHVLALLFTVWSVNWKATAGYARVDQLAQAEFVKASFCKEAGKAWESASGGLCLCCAQGRGRTKQPFVGGASTRGGQGGRVGFGVAGNEVDTCSKLWVHRSADPFPHTAHTHTHGGQVVPAKFSGRRAIVPLTARVLVRSP
jgi:hypothetical protein